MYMIYDRYSRDFISVSFLQVIVLHVVATLFEK